MATVTERDTITHDIASVTVSTAPYQEYIHTVRTQEGWKIANVLWQPM